MTLDRTPRDAELERTAKERLANPAFRGGRLGAATVPGPNNLLHLARRTEPAAGTRTRRRSEDREHLEQAALVDWANSNAMLGRYPELAALYAIPNAAKRGKREAAKMKAEGLVKGSPDLVLPVPRRNPTPGPHRVFGGFYLEMKDFSTGALKKAQVERIALLRGVGNFCDVALSAEAGKALLLYYLSLERP